MNRIDAYINNVKKMAPKQKAIEQMLKDKPVYGEEGFVEPPIMHGHIPAGMEKAPPPEPIPPTPSKTPFQDMANPRGWSVTDRPSMNGTAEYVGKVAKDIKDVKDIEKAVGEGKVTESDVRGMIDKYNTNTVRPDIGANYDAYGTKPRTPSFDKYGTSAPETSPWRSETVPERVDKWTRKEVADIELPQGEKRIYLDDAQKTPLSEDPKIRESRRGEWTKENADGLEVTFKSNPYRAPRGTYDGMNPVLDVVGNSAKLIGNEALSFLRENSPASAGYSGTYGAINPNTGAEQIDTIKKNYNLLKDADIPAKVGELYEAGKSKAQTLLDSSDTESKIKPTPVATTTTGTNVNPAKPTTPKSGGTVNVPEVRKEVANTQNAVAQASTDPNMFADLASKIGIPREVAHMAFSGAADVAGRIDWLTAAIVYAGARGSGSNQTKAIANGLFRGMEARQNQQAGALEAKNKAYELETDRIKAKAYKRAAARKGSGDEDLSLMNKYSRKDVESQITLAMEELGLDAEFWPWGRSDAEAAGIQSIATDYVVQQLSQGDERGIRTLAKEGLKIAKDQQQRERGA